MSVRCFLLEPTEIYVRKLRCWGGNAGSCALHGFHRVEVELERGAAIPTEEGQIVGNVWAGMPGDDDPRWPQACSCGWPFGPEHRYRDQHMLYRRSDTGELLELNDAPPGAMWRATWMEEWYRGDDGRCYIVRCPGGGDWMIDGPASNCGIPDDRHQERHHCWIRHGEAPNFTVDKNGKTCSAGGGSIQTHNWHGFLRNGELVE